MSKQEKLRATRTSRYLIEALGRQNNPEVFVRPRSSSEGRYLHSERLTVFVTPKHPVNSANVADGIKNCSDDVLFFCDTSLFDLDTDDRIWEALLRLKRQLILLPSVEIELQPWLKARPNHRMARAIVEEHSSINFFQYRDLPDWALPCITYYLNLLGLRKKLLTWKELEFEQAQGRLPAPDEETALRAQLQREVGPRGYLLAKKGYSTLSTRTSHTDEELVCTAVATALTSGRPVYILTKDEDLQEQFYKLQWLIDTHYRGMLLAQSYHRDPFSFAVRSWPQGQTTLDEAFIGRNNVLIQWSRQLLDDVLPPTWTPVPIVCTVLGRFQTTMVVIAELEMAQLLEIKGKTGGLSVDRVDGRNCHIELSPLGLPSANARCAALALDRRLPTLKSAPVEIPFLDVQLAINTNEPVPKVMEYSPELITVPEGWYR